MYPCCIARQITAAKPVSAAEISARSRSRVEKHSATYIVRVRRSILSNRRKPKLSVATLSAATLTEVQEGPVKDKIPASLQKYVAQLTLQRHGRPVQIYILGSSHVSRQSCNHAVQLMSAVKPNTVLLELCKDRVDLLVDPSMPPPQHWHSRVINIQSSSLQQASITASAFKKLLSSLRCQQGRPFSASDIEQDCIQLLSSGMFASVTPMTQPASASDAPMFIFHRNKVSKEC